MEQTFKKFKSTDKLLELTNKAFIYTSNEHIEKNLMSFTIATAKINYTGLV